MSGGIEPYESFVGSLLDDAERVLVVTADPDCPEALVAALYGIDADDRPRVDLLATERVCDRIDRDFSVASRARDLDVEGDLAVRTLPDRDVGPSLFVTDEAAVAVVPLGGGEVTSADLSAEAADRLRDRYRSTWDEVMPHAVDAPPYSRLVARIGDALGDEARADFESGLEAVHARGPDDRLGPVEVALLVAAARGEELRAVVDWATSTDLASQGTVSRAKKRLEEVGIVDTEPVKIGVGRPRQRLVLAEEFDGLSVDDLVETAVATA